jgi:hypothetical protein
MKRLVAIWMSILFISGSLFPGTDVEEVYKVPQMLMHFNEHKKEARNEGKSFDFMEFLLMHYGFSSDHAQTPHNDTELPMYKHLSTGLTFIMPELFIFSFSAKPTLNTSQALYLENYRSQYYITFLQPPQA